MTLSLDRPESAPTDASLAVYVHAIRECGLIADDPAAAAAAGEALGLPADVVARSIEHLTDLLLLRREYRGGWWRLVPVSPDVAAAALILPIGEEIYRKRAVISKIQSSLVAFQAHYEANRDTGVSQPGAETIADRREFAGQLHLAVERCEAELMAFRPDGQLSLEQLVPLARRGPWVRLMLTHAVRTDLRARAVLKPLCAAGGEVRTAGHLPRQMVIVDAQLAFLLHGDDSGPAGVVIRHADTVRLLTDVVETTWDAAEPYEPEEAADIGYGQVTNDLRRTVVEQLAAGRTDEAIARHLGMSVRTCRRHIAAVLTTLGAVSRFQAGALAVSTGLLDTRRLRAGSLDRPVPPPRRGALDDISR